MRFTAVILALPVLGLATPSRRTCVERAENTARQSDSSNGTLVQPPPCIRATPVPSAEVTEARFDKFANAFLVTKNITEAFTYITEDYINHNPLAQNGSASAWSILSPIWASQNITVLRTAFESPFGWLNYQSSFGEIVDRFRWEGGCIAEHWDQGEVFPTS